MEDTKLEKERKSLSQGDADDGGSSKASFVAGQDLLLLPMAGRHHDLLHMAGFLLSSPINLDTSIFSASINLLLSPPNTGCFSHSRNFPCNQPSLISPSSYPTIIGPPILTSVMCFGSHDLKEGWLVALRGFWEP